MAMTNLKNKENRSQTHPKQKLWWDVMAKTFGGSSVCKFQPLITAELNTAIWVPQLHEGFAAYWMQKTFECKMIKYDRRGKGMSAKCRSAVTAKKSLATVCIMI